MHRANMSIKNESRGKGVRGYQAAALAAGSLLAGLAASSCCILPLVLFSLGVSGAWIGSFTPLAAYQSIFIVATLACLGAGAWLNRRTTSAACSEADVCPRALPRRLIKVALVVAAMLVAAALGVDFFAPLLRL
jgi:mercuric ion transport protein